MMFLSYSRERTRNHEFQHLISNVLDNVKNVFLVKSVLGVLKKVLGKKKNQNHLKFSATAMATDQTTPITSSLSSEQQSYK